MEILINETPFELPDGATLAEALHAYGAKPPFAAAVNCSFVHRHQYHETALRPGDRIEVVQPVAGG